MGPPVPRDLPDLLNMEKDELDELFRQSPAGEVPDGGAEGIFLVRPGSGITRLASKVIHLVAWHGKVFRRAAGEVENKILPVGLEAVRAKVYKDPSWFDGKETIVLDYSTTSFVARNVRDEIREVSPDFYLGLVFWRRRRVAFFGLRLARGRG